MRIMPIFNCQKEFYYEFELPLARRFYEINARGVRVDLDRLRDLRSRIDSELRSLCEALAQQFQRPVVPSADFSDAPGALNLSSVPQLKAALASLGIKLPKDRETHRESTSEDALIEAFAKTGHEALKLILRIRELLKVRGTYVNARLDGDILYSAYSVAGTVTGRRSARANYRGLGTNHQNLPKHTALGKAFRDCIVARPGRVFLQADRRQAEDYVVQALIAAHGGSPDGLWELNSGVDRHAKLASFLLDKPVEECGKGTPERELIGKRVRHAGNYGVSAATLAAVMAREGYPLPPKVCEFLLQRFHQLEPGIRGVFHKYIENELFAKRQLVTPIGRRRQFFGLRPRSDNGTILRDAYSYIPQSTIGDLTGLTILRIESVAPLVVMDMHDAVVLEVPEDHLNRAIALLRDAGSVPLDFGNGIVIDIPQDFEFGYSLGSLRKWTG
jgi:DNA polymerase-1